MKSHRTRLRWLSTKNELGRGAERAYALGIAVAPGQRWQRSCVTAAAEPIEKHRSVWASRRDDRQIEPTESAAPWWSPDAGGDAEIRRKT